VLPVAGIDPPDEGERMLALGARVGVDALGVQPIELALVEGDLQELSLDADGPELFDEMGELGKQQVEATRLLLVRISEEIWPASTRPWPRSRSSCERLKRDTFWR
jgi:hypothetical protein